MDVLEARRKLHLTFDEREAGQAPLAYYALYHPPQKTALALHEDERHQVVGFAGRLQTGLDLFRPVVILQAGSPESAARLLGQLLVAGRPYILFMPQTQAGMIGGSLHIENARTMRLFAVDTRRFHEEINVLVRHNRAPDGSPRMEISNPAGRAVAGVNWRSPAFAEIFVETDAAVRGRGWGTSVVNALTGALLKEGQRALYLVDEQNDASLALLAGLPFEDTGMRYIYADTVYSGNPATSNQGS